MTPFYDVIKTLDFINFRPLKNLVFSEGRSNAYLVHGVGVLALMGVLAFWTYFSFVLFPLALALFYAESGVEIDQRNLAVRRYVGVAGFRKGIWIPLRVFTSLELDETVVMHQHRSFFRYQKSTSRTYDLMGVLEGGKAFQINDFFDYRQAVDCGEAIARLSKIDFHNYYAEKTAEMGRRPRRR